MSASIRTLSRRVSGWLCAWDSRRDKYATVYSKDMPERLPFFLILRQFSQQVVSSILFGIRAALVATVWLAALPWATIWTWRMYFALGNSACVRLSS